MQNKTRWLRQKDHDFIFDRVPRLCVDLLIKDKRGFVFVKRDIPPQKGRWHMPGGMVRRHETLAASAKRLAKEETGLNIRVERLVGYIEFLHEIQNGKDRHSVSLVFLVRAESLRGLRKDSAIKFFKKLPTPFNSRHKEFLQLERVFRRA